LRGRRRLPALLKAFLVVLAAAAVLVPAAGGTSSAAPSAPTNLRASVIGRTVYLTWNLNPPTEQVAAYVVYRDGQAIATTGPSPEYADTRLVATRTEYAVQARDRTGNASTLSAPVSVAPPASAPQVPGKPPDLVAPPRIAGRARPGWMLRVRRAQWKGSTPTRVSYQWLRCRPNGACANIFGGTRPYYRVRRADVGWRLRVVETARHASGTTTASSPPSAIVKR
jgi:hypothetical protein